MQSFQTLTHYYSNAGGYIRSGSGESDGYASSGSSAGGWSPTVAQSILAQYTTRQLSSASDSPTLSQLAAVSISGTGTDLSPPQQQQPPPQQPLIGDASWLPVGGANVNLNVNAAAVEGVAQEPPALINLAGLPTDQMDEFLRSLLNLNLPNTNAQTQQPVPVPVPAPLPASQSQALPQAQPSQPQTNNEAAAAAAPSDRVFSFRGLILGPTPPVNAPLSNRYA